MAKGRVPTCDIENVGKNVTFNSVGASGTWPVREKGKAVDTNQRKDMKIKMLGVSCAVVVAFTLTACGPDAGTPMGSSEDTAAADSALTFMTVPPAGLGFSWVGNLRLKNGTGLCAYKNGSKFETAACSSASSQVFAIYQMSDGGYEVCVPNTLTGDSNGLGFADIPTYTATCVVRAGSSGLKFEVGKPLSMWFGKNDWRPYKGSIIRGAQLTNGFTLGWLGTSLKLQRAASGGIGLGGYTGAINQQWLVY